MSKQEFIKLYRKYYNQEKTCTRAKYGKRGKSFTLDEPLVVIGGNDIPDPAKFFVKTLTKHVTPTTVERHTIPAIMEGRDLMACVSIGRGTRGAFVIPIAQLVIQGRTYSSCGPFVLPVALILCPTVQKAKKVFHEYKELCSGTGVKVRSGEEVANHKPHMKSFDVDILVATPQQILEIIDVPEQLNKAALALLNIKYLALEEADELLSNFHMDILRIINHTDMPSSRQTMFFSETFTSQHQLLASDFLKSDYIFFCEGERGSGKLICEDIRTEDNSTDIEYAYRQPSFSECDQKLGDNNVDWEF